MNTKFFLIVHLILSVVASLLIGGLTIELSGPIWLACLAYSLGGCVVFVALTTARARRRVKVR